MSTTRSQDQTQHLHVLGTGKMPELQGGPSTALLESFPNRYPQRPYVISIAFPEFTSLCPVTGQPDMGTITVEYIPDQLCVESKSFKLYMFAFRNHQSFMETITNTVLEDLWTVLEPCWCRVKGLFVPRGGTRIHVFAEQFKDMPEEKDAAVRAAAGVLRARGAVVEECSLPLLDYAVPAYYILACAEASSNLARFDGVKYGWRAEGCGSLEELYRRTRTEGFGPEVKKRILLGTFVLSADCYDSYYKKALQARARLKAAFDAVFQRYDLLLTPVAPTTAPRLGEGLADPLSLYLSDVFIINLLSNYLIQTCCCCRSLICSLYCRQIFDCQNFFCNTFIMRRCKLCAIFPVYLVTIVFRRVVACSDIDTCYAAQLTYCKGQLWCWTKRLKLICLDAICC